MLYITFTLLAIVIGVLVLHVRLRGRLEDSRRYLMLSLGRRSGVMLDFARQEGALQVMTIPVYRFELDGSRKPEKQKERAEPAVPKPARRRRRRLDLRHWLSGDRLHNLWTILTRSQRAAWGFVRGLLRSTVLEELQTRIEAGLDAPDRTGQLFGYYQAALGVVPALHQRLVFVPDWTGASFAASGRFAVAIPLYKLIWRTTVLFWQLPSRKVAKMAIKKRKGDLDVE
jgi:hypothetical protein